MRTAIFYNFMDNIGGAEIVCLILARELGADIYTTNINRQKIRKMGFEDVLPRIKSIGKVPLNSPWRQELALIRFRLLNLAGKYDLFIIEGEWAVSGAVNNRPNLWYAHSTLRELWDLNESLRQEKNFHNLLIFDFWTFLHRYLDRKYTETLDAKVCNSGTTRNRIIKYLHEDAKVIYPPVETKDYRCGKDKGYWLSVNRLLKQKRVDMQVKAFQMLPDEKLVIVGSYEKGSKPYEEYVSHLKKIKPSNVEILHWVDDKRLKELYAHCRGFITTPVEEDFGLTAVEAMASGKPVIAPNSGGYKETVIDGKTGLLINNLDEKKLAEAVLKVEKELRKNPKKYMEACIKQAGKFDISVFVRNIKREIEKIKTSETRNLKKSVSAFSYLKFPENIGEIYPRKMRESWINSYHAAAGMAGKFIKSLFPPVYKKLKPYFPSNNRPFPHIK